MGDCVAPDLCGECLPNFAVAITSSGISSIAMVSAKCTRQAATPTLARGVGTHGGAIFAPSAAVDSDVETAWKAFAPDSSDASFTEPPTLTVTYHGEFPMRHYTMTSAPTLPSMDPKSWMLHGRKSSADEWTLLDHRNGVSFSARRETISFFPAHIQSGAKEESFSFREYRLTISDVKDAAAQTNGATVTLNTDNRGESVVVGNVKPQVQVGEFVVYGDTGHSGVNSNAHQQPSAMAPAGVAALVLFLIAVVVILVVIIAAVVVTVTAIKVRQKRGARNASEGTHTQFDSDYDVEMKGSAVGGVQSDLAAKFGVQSEAELQAMTAARKPLSSHTRPSGTSVAM